MAEEYDLLGAVDRVMDVFSPGDEPKRKTKSQKLTELHAEAMEEFSEISAAVLPGREESLEDRKFCSITGYQWAGAEREQFKNKPMLEFNKVHLAVMRIMTECRLNDVTVDFVSRDGALNDKLADTLDGLFRADEQDCNADEAYYNGREEAITGGFGAWRLCHDYEDDSDEDDTRQRIKIEPIFDADKSVFFDLDAKRQDKSDAKRCFVLKAMTPREYERTWGESPSTWPEPVTDLWGEFTWADIDVVYVAEYYVVEEKSETIRIYRSIDGSEEKYRQSDFDSDEELEEKLDAVGSYEIRRKDVKRKRVHKYILSGNSVLKDCGYIAGPNIPIIPCYGKRWFVDNIERFMGHVRLAKDPQRLKNMQVSRLAEISALSTIEKPIFTPEQINNHKLDWAEDNIENNAYLLVDPVTAADGSETPMGPLAYTKVPNIPPALAALMVSTEQDLQDVLGNQQQGDKVVSNIADRTVERIQSRLDMQTFIFNDNYAIAIKRTGIVWFGIKKEIAVEEGRKLKVLSADKKPSQIELYKPVVNSDTGEIEYENDLSSANFDVAVEVGPSSASKRSATVRTLMDLMAVTQDPEAIQVLGAMIMMNVEGEGVSEVRDYYRRKLVRMGVVKPTEEEQQELAAEAQAAASQPPDAQQQYLQAAASEAEAKAAQARVNTIKTMADAELSRAKTSETEAKTIQTLAGVDQSDRRLALDVLSQIQSQQQPSAP